MKDNESIPFLDDEPLARSEPQGFSPDQMVRCEDCLRANPPIRVSCLYCGKALPAAKVKVDHRNLNLKPIENSAQGYNNILLPQTANEFVVKTLDDAANLLKFDTADLRQIIDARSPLPIARTATREEADLINRRLQELGLQTTVVSDAELGLEQSPICIRAAAIRSGGIILRQIGGGDGVDVAWNEILLLVTGRVITKRVESAERKGRRGETEIIEATELFTDELMMDLYLENRPESFRIAANNFDFSCLPKKGVVAAENFLALVNLIREHGDKMELNDAFQSVRQVLDFVWPSGQHTGSRGWRRERPGKYNIEAVTESSNLNQFTRYSRLRHLFVTKATLTSLDS